MLGVGIHKKYYTCNITDTCSVIHQNHGYNNVSQDKINILRTNNSKCRGHQRYINESSYKSIILNGDIQFIER